MAQLIPNENTFIGFLAAAAGKPFGTTTTGAPTLAEINAAVNMTDFFVSLNASSSGNAVPTPRLSSRFETSVPGTASATFTGDAYRDDAADTLWDAVPRGTRGTFIVKRFGGTGANGRPVAGQKCEVWPIDVVSRAAGALQSGAAQMFTINASVPSPPNENYVTPAA